MIYISIRVINISTSGYLSGVLFDILKILFVDIAKVLVRAGRGGNGVVSFRHEKYVDKGVVLTAVDGRSWW